MGSMSRDFPRQQGEEMRVKELEKVLVEVASMIIQFDSVQFQAQDLIREVLKPKMSRAAFNDWLETQSNE